MKRLRWIKIGLLILAMSMIVAPAYAQEAESAVNLPGWVGWLLVILAIVLVVATSVWVRRPRSR